MQVKSFKLNFTCPILSSLNRKRACKSREGEKKIMIQVYKAEQQINEIEN